MATMILKPSEGFDYYTDTVYWNDFEVVKIKINQAISGNPTKNWCQHVRDLYGCFETGLFVNCGNGWVERDLFRERLVQKVIGFDISETLIRTAVAEATKIGMPFVYTVDDANRTDLDGIDARLVVNHGAIHHVAYIDRLTRRLCKVLKSGGIYVGFDYTGAHRNQYSWAAWSSMMELSASLPERFRERLVYPHLNTMLHNDPTEAIHSELQIDVLRRYFNIEQFVPLGGALAYQMLFQNRQLYNERHTPEGIETLQRIIDADLAFLAADPASSLFSFWVATPKAHALDDALTLTEWENEENLREEKAVRNRGRYYKVSALEIIYDEIARDAAARAVANVERDVANAERNTANVERDVANAERNAARAERDAARAERDVARAERDALLQSTSWTITAPLRAMISTIRRR